MTDRLLRAFVLTMFSLAFLLGLALAYSCSK